MFFDNWAGLVRVLVVGLLAYSALVVLLRVSGKRTLAKMNAFDLVVTVALGLTLATILLSVDVALVEGVLGLALLVALQLMVAWMSVRVSAFGGRSRPSRRCCCTKGSSAKKRCGGNAWLMKRCARPCGRRVTAALTTSRRSCWRPMAASVSSRAPRLGQAARLATSKPERHWAERRTPSDAARARPLQ
jgi:hypothetical protein